MLEHHRELYMIMKITTGLKPLVIGLMACAALVAGAVHGHAAAAENTAAQTLHMIIGDPESSEMGFVAKTFKEYVEKQSKGALAVSYRFNRDPAEDEGVHFHRVQIGKLDLAIGGVSNLAPMTKRLDVVTLPYLFPTVDDVVKGTEGKAAELLNSYALEAGLRILAWTYSGYRNISNSQHPITTLDDLRGLRIRVPQSYVMAETYRALGAIPSLVQWENTRAGLSEHAIDGQCYGYIGFEAMDFLGAGQKYLTEMRHVYNLQPLVINEKRFQALPADQQSLLIAAGMYAQRQVLIFEQQQAKLRKEALMAKGLRVAQLADEPVWKNIALTKVWPKVMDSLGGKETVNAYLKSMGRPTLP